MIRESWNTQLNDAITVLTESGDDVVASLARCDFFESRQCLIDKAQESPEARKILRRQKPDGSWSGPAGRQPAVYPPSHGDLVATIKNFRILVERYRFDRRYPAVDRAGQYLFSFQTTGGDFRGFIANQYATYYTGYVIALLIDAGFGDDTRIERGMEWLTGMRQDDGGWTIPILTHRFDGKTMYRLTSSFAEPVEPVRSEPFSHNWTDMVLRAFAAHPIYRQSDEALFAGRLLKSRFFKPDVYSSYKSSRYWTRFVLWWPNLLTSLESLSLMGFSCEDQDIKKGLRWFFENRKEDGLWDCAYDGKTKPAKQNSRERLWVSLRICRMLKRFLG